MNHLNTHPKHQSRIHPRNKNLKPTKWLYYFFPLYLTLLTAPAAAMDITLTWDRNQDVPDAGYRVFIREEGREYTYDRPDWTGFDNSCIISNLSENQTYYFVARAFTEDNLESADSNEVCLAQSMYVGSAPLKPGSVSPMNGVFINQLTPQLKATPFMDYESTDHHAESEWQISSDPNFGSQVLNLTTPNHLESMPVPELILKPETRYYWRVRYLDDRGLASPWTEPAEFQTEAASVADTNGNGIPDSVEISSMTDIDAEGTPDINQNDIKAIKSAADSDYIAVKLDGSEGSISALQPVEPDTITETYNRPIQLPAGLIAFKLSVASGSMVHVDLFYTKPLPDNIRWGKYDLVTGWSDYTDNVEIEKMSNGATRIGLNLEDGGIGDADGVVNGVIIDPAGPAVFGDNVPAAQDGGGGSGGCFIDTMTISSLW